jgi:hypothetical protein
MKDVLTALVEFSGQQTMALQAVADHVSALKKTLIFHYPEIEDNLNSQIAAEQKESARDVAEVQKRLAILREAVSRLPD